MTLRWHETLDPAQVRRLRKIVDELDEFIDAPEQLINYMSCSSAIEFLQDQINAYKDDAEKDELYTLMVKLVAELKQKAAHSAKLE